MWHRSLQYCKLGSVMNSLLHYNPAELITVWLYFIECTSAKTQNNNLCPESCFPNFTVSITLCIQVGFLFLKLLKLSISSYLSNYS